MRWLGRLSEGFFTEQCEIRTSDFRNLVPRVPRTGKRVEKQPEIDNGVAGRFTRVNHSAIQ
jgi:hypothetical protein